MTEGVSPAPSSRFITKNETRVRWSALKLYVPVIGKGSLIIVTKSRANVCREFSCVSKIGACPGGGDELGVPVNDAVWLPSERNLAQYQLRCSDLFDGASRPDEPFGFAS